jgi:hypothetical protein
MERIILVLSMLAGLHVVLSFLRFAVESLKNVFIRSQEETATPDEVSEVETVEVVEVVEVVEDKTIDWRQYDVPAYIRQRRNRIEADLGKNSDASFEVIA